MLPKAPKSIWSACLPCMIFYLFIYFIIFAIASKSNKREKDRNRDLKGFFFSSYFIFTNLKKKNIYLYLIGELFFFFFFGVNKQVLTKKYVFLQNYSESI